jgi:hypothetical protein
MFLFTRCALWRSAVRLSVLCGKGFKSPTTENTEFHRGNLTEEVP